MVSVTIEKALGLWVEEVNRKPVLADGHRDRETETEEVERPAQVCAASKRQSQAACTKELGGCAEIEGRGRCDQLGAKAASQVGQDGT